MFCEDLAHVVYVFVTVLVADLLIFVPAALVYYANCSKGATRRKVKLLRKNIHMIIMYIRQLKPKP